MGRSRKLTLLAVFLLILVFSDVLTSTYAKVRAGNAKKLPNSKTKKKPRAKAPETKPKPKSAPASPQGSHGSPGSSNPSAKHQRVTYPAGAAPNPQHKPKPTDAASPTKMAGETHEDFMKRMHDSKTTGETQEQFLKRMHEAALEATKKMVAAKPQYEPGDLDRKLAGTPMGEYLRKSRKLVNAISYLFDKRIIVLRNLASSVSEQVLVKRPIATTGSGFQAELGNLTAFADDSFTVSFWLLLNPPFEPTPRDKTTKSLISRAHSPGRPVTPSVAVTNTNNIHLMFSSVKMKNGGLLCHFPIPRFKWTHIAYTFNDNKIFLFVDGQQQMFDPKSPLLFPEWDVPLVIGGMPGRGTPRALISLLTVFDRPFSLSDVGAIRKGTLPPPIPAPAFHLDEWSRIRPPAEEVPEPEQRALPSGDESGDQKDSDKGEETGAEMDTREGGEAGKSGEGSESDGSNEIGQNDSKPEESMSEAKEGAAAASSGPSNAATENGDETEPKVATDESKEQEPKADKTEEEAKEEDRLECIDKCLEKPPPRQPLYRQLTTCMEKESCSMKDANLTLCVEKKCKPFWSACQTVTQCHDPFACLAKCNHGRMLAEIKVYEAKKKAEEEKKRLAEIESVGPLLELIPEGEDPTFLTELAIDQLVRHISTELLNPQSLNERDVSCKLSLLTLTTQTGTGNLTSVDIGGGILSLEHAAALGDGRAFRYLGLLTNLGLGVEKNESVVRRSDTSESSTFFDMLRQGETLLLTAALLGDVGASVALGSRQMVGSEEGKCPVAAFYYQHAAQRVSNDVEKPSSHRQMAQVRFEDGNFKGQGGEDDEVIQFHQYAADNGDAHSQVVMARALYWGQHGLERDLEAAADYYHQAALQENPDAHFSLGTMYLKGSGVEKNETKGLEMFERAEELGHPAAANGLGVMHLNGQVVTKNTTQAFLYFEKSAAGGNPDAMFNTGLCHLNGWGTKRNITAAFNYFKKAARYEQPRALNMAGTMLVTGEAGEKDCQAGLKLLKKGAEKGPWNEHVTYALDNYIDGETEQALVYSLIAAEMGFEIANANVAFLAESEILQHYNSQYDPDMDWTFRFQKRAADFGDSKAAIAVGDCLYEGSCAGSEKNVSLAAEYYEKAADRRQPQAIFDVGWFYETGEPPYERNLTEALMHYRKCSESLTGLLPCTLSIYKFRVYSWLLGEEWSEAWEAASAVWEAKEEERRKERLEKEKEKSVAASKDHWFWGTWNKLVNSHTENAIEGDEEVTQLDFSSLLPEGMNIADWSDLALLSLVTLFTILFVARLQLAVRA